MRRLNVYFGRELVGVVDTDDAGRFSFAYQPSWLEDRQRFPISQSLPLIANAQTGEAAHAFFANLLPEGRVRTLVARRLGISEDNDFDLLAAIGGECAGALVLAEDVPEATGHRYRPLDDLELARIAKTGTAFAELVGGGGIRLSLA